jgi:hypothetical protein
MKFIPDLAMPCHRQCTSLIRTQTSRHDARLFENEWLGRSESLKTELSSDQARKQAFGNRARASTEFHALLAFPAKSEYRYLISRHDGALGEYKKSSARIAWQMVHFEGLWT